MKTYLKNDFDFAKLVPVFDELPLWSAPFGLKLLDYIDYRPGITALDIGFGCGFPLTEIALRLGDTALVYGIDPWAAAIERVRQKLDYYGLANVRVIEGMAEAMPLDNGVVDLITSNNGLNNVGDIDRALAECARVMKKGGQFVQTMNLDMSMFEFYDILEQVLSGMHLDETIGRMRAHIAQKRPPLARMVSMLRQQGFVIKDLEHGQFNYRFASGTAMLNHYFIRLAFMEAWIKILPPDRVEEVFDAVEQRLNSQAPVSGGITLSIPFALINAVKE